MRVFTLAEANRMLPLVKGIVEDILETGKVVRRMAFDFGSSADELPEYRRNFAALHEFIRELEDLGCVYKDYNFTIGLVDFPAIINDREVFLCWRSDEQRLMYYHGVEDGYNGRKLIPEELLYDFDSEDVLEQDSDTVHKDGSE